MRIFPRTPEGVPRPGTLEALFTLLLLEPEGASSLARAPERTRFAVDLQRQLDSILAPGALAPALEQLATHRVLPLLTHQLEAFGRLGALAEPERTRLLQARRRARELNSLLFLSAAGLLQTAQQLGTTPLVLKGLLLADSYYPELATRPMGDLDLVAAPGERSLLLAALERCGFSRVLDHVDQAHAEAFENLQGVACDAHGYIESYPEANWEEVTRVSSMQLLQGVRVRVLEPNMMLAHLVDHLHGHSQEGGLVLLWLLDIAFVLRKHGGEFDLARLRRAIAKPAVWGLLLRVLGLLERHGAPLPGSLAPLRPAIRRLPRLSLAAVMRGRRTIPWGLPTPLGYLRVLAQRLSLRDYSQHNARTPPSISDLCWLPVDLLTTRWAELARYRH
jgi:hypothetical protein